MNSPRSSQQPGLAATHAGRMKLLDRAKWNLAVLAELAEPGHMALAAVFDNAGQVVDFAWREASPTATLALGCAGEELVGRTLKQVLVECAIDPCVFDSYRTVFLQTRAQVFRVGGKDGDTLHAISPLPPGLTVEVTRVAAIDRVTAAQLAVRGLE